MKAADRLHVTAFSEVEGYLVRGTMDKTEARAALAKYLTENPGEYGPWSQEDAQRHADSLTADAGWKRWNLWHDGMRGPWIEDGKEGQRGSFPAVEFWP